AADHERIDLCNQVLENRELGRDLGSADKSGHRPFGLFKSRRERGQFGLHGKAGTSGQVARNRMRGGVRTMCTGKGIVEIDLPERRQLACELEVIIFLSLVEPHVLQNRDLARGHARETLARGLSDAIRYEADRDVAQHVSESSSDGREREFGLATARTAEMREQDHAR